MSWGNPFKSAWNAASDATKQAAATVAAGASAATKWVTETASKVLANTGQKIEQVGKAAEQKAAPVMAQAKTVATTVVNTVKQAFNNLQKTFSSTQPSKTVEKCPATGKNWNEAEIKDEWAKTDAGKSVLENLPSSTAFNSYTKPEGDDTNAYYSPKENAIYIPDCYTSREAAPTAGHEAVHAYQSVVQKRPTSEDDSIEMEVEAKNKGLDIYDQMGRPAVPYGYASELKFRETDADAYNEAVRKMYKKLYGVE